MALRAHDLPRARAIRLPFPVVGGFHGVVSLVHRRGRATSFGAVHGTAAARQLRLARRARRTVEPRSALTGARRREKPRLGAIRAGGALHARVVSRSAVVARFARPVPTAVATFLRCASAVRAELAAGTNHRTVDHLHAEGAQRFSLVFNVLHIGKQCICVRWCGR